MEPISNKYGYVLYQHGALLLRDALLLEGLFNAEGHATDEGCFTSEGHAADEGCFTDRGHPAEN